MARGATSAVVRWIGSTLANSYIVTSNALAGFAGRHTESGTALGVYNGNQDGDLPKCSFHGFSGQGYGLVAQICSGKIGDQNYISSGAGLPWQAGAGFVSPTSLTWCGYPDIVEWKAMKRLMSWKAEGQ